MPKKRKLAPSRLNDYTLHLLKNRPRHITYAHIAEQTGLGRDWLQEYSRSRFDSPGVKQVETLYRYLTGHDLDV